MDEPKYAYICGTDYNWELGNALPYTELYPSVEALKKERACWEQCGILKVKVVVEDFVEKPEPWGDKDA